MKPLEPRDGEILGPEDRVRFYLFPHPLKPDRKVIEVPTGLSISEALEYALDVGDVRQYRHNFIIYLQDGTLVPEHMWDRVRPKPSVAVIARPVAEGPIFAVFGAISAAASAFSAAIASLGFFGHLLMMGITIGVKFLLAKLFAPKPPKQPMATDAKASYSISGSRNQVLQWGTIPLILGRHRITPPLAASPYTETVGDDQYLRQLFCNGYGPLDIEAASCKIGETALSVYTEATIQHRYGFAIDEAPTSLYPRSVIELPLSIELKQVDAAITQTTATDCVQIGLDFTWPQGLTTMDPDGQRHDRGTQIDMQYRAVGASTWINIPSLAFVKATQAVIRRTVVFNFPAMGQYEVKVHKFGPDPQQRLTDAHYLEFDQIIWTAMRSFRTGEPVTFNDAPISVTAIRIKATGRLNNIVDTYNVIVSSKVTAWNGSAWVANTISRRPPDLFRHVLTCKANRRPYPVSQIDLPALQAWWSYCVNQGWYYDKVILEAMTVFDLLIEICAAGRAMPVFKDGKWSVVWDEQNVPVVQLFTPRNSWNFEEQRDLDPIPHGYRIRFPNASKGWLEDERVVYNDGYSKANATLLEGFDVPGQTDTNRVWKHGRFHLAQRILRPGVYSLMTSWDALPLIRGDRVRVNYDTFKYGLYSGRVVAIDASAQVVYMDTNVVLAGATNYLMRFRLSNGTFLERTIDPGYVGEFTVVGLVGTGLPMPAVGDLFDIGYATNDSKILRVVGIEPQENLVHRLTMVADAPEIADADTGAIPDYNDGITQPIDPFLLPPRNIRVTDGAYFDGGSQYWAFLSVSWEPPPYGRVTLFQIEYRDAGDSEGIWKPVASVTPQITTTEIRKLESGTYTVRVRCIFDNGQHSDWTYAPAHATTEFTTPPPDVDNFLISTMGDISILRWDPVPGVGITYEIRFASNLVALPDWNAATTLVNTANTNVQIGTRVGTFFIKAKKPWGLSSLNEISIYTLVGTLTGINFIQQIDEHPGFLGVHDHTEVIAPELRLADDATHTSYELSGYYYFSNSINLGELTSCRVSTIIDAYGYSPQSAMSNWVTLAAVDPLDTVEKVDWKVQPEYRITKVNPTLNQWEDWQILGLTDVVAWAIQFRILLSGKPAIDISTNDVRSSTTPAIKQLSVVIDMVDRIEKGNDLTAPAAGLVVTYPNGAFRAVPAVVVTPQNMVQGDYYTIPTATKTDTSFKVNFFDKNNAGKSMVFDWVAKGWGKVQ
jgi:hypothetical protein